MPDWVLQVVAILGASCGVYAGVKSDITRAILKADHAGDSARRAHERIDGLLK